MAAPTARPEVEASARRGPPGAAGAGPSRAASPARPLCSACPGLRVSGFPSQRLGGALVPEADFRRLEPRKQEEPGDRLQPVPSEECPAVAREEAPSGFCPRAAPARAPLSESERSVGNAGGSAAVCGRGAGGGPARAGRVRGVWTQRGPEDWDPSPGFTTGFEST